MNINKYQLLLIGKQIVRNFLIFIMLLAFSSLSNAFSVDYIVNRTKGKTSHSQAVRIVKSVDKYSHLYKVDPVTVFKIIQTESNFNPDAKAKNCNCIGLMQVIPRWHKDKIRGRNLSNIEVNIEVGVRILKDNLELNKGNMRRALWGYNASSTKKQYANKILLVKENELFAYIHQKHFLNI